MIHDFSNFTQRPQRITSLSVHRKDLTFKQPFKSAKMDLAKRPITLVRVETDLGVGWGECSALPEPFYNDETAASCFEYIADQLSNDLRNRRMTIEGLASEASASHRFSFAAVEMALLHVLIQDAGGFGEIAQSLPFGPVLGVSDSTRLQVLDCVDKGAKRIKLKVSPETDIALLEELTSEFQTIRFDVDANGSFSADEFQKTKAIFEAGIRTFEQPFAVENTKSARELVEYCNEEQLVCADEAASTFSDTLKVVSERTANAVCIKPSRLGGLFNAQELSTELRSRNVDFYLGGMLESGLGRVFLALATIVCEPTLIGDLTPASFLYSDQPFNDLEFNDGALHLPSEILTNKQVG